MSKGIVVGAVATAGVVAAVVFGSSVIVTRVHREISQSNSGAVALRSGAEYPKPVERRPLHTKRYILTSLPSPDPGPSSPPPMLAAAIPNGPSSEKAGGAVLPLVPGFAVESAVDQPIDCGTAVEVTLENAAGDRVDIVGQCLASPVGASALAQDSSFTLQDIGNVQWLTSSIAPASTGVGPFFVVARSDSGGYMVVVEVSAKPGDGLPIGVAAAQSIASSVSDTVGS